MQVIITGCGRVGSRLAGLLSHEGHNVVVIDSDPDSFEHLELPFNGVTLVGMAFDEDLLVEAGIREADAFVALTNYDNTNLMAAEIAAGIFGVPQVVARVYNPDKEPTYRNMGIDYICGSSLLAEVFHRTVTAGGILRHVDRGKGLQVLELEMDPGCVGLKVSDLRSPGKGRLMAIMREDRPVYFSRDTELEPGDHLLLAVDAGDRSFLEKVVPIVSNRYRSREDQREMPAGTRRDRGGWRVIVAGCGRVGAQLAEMLSLDGYHVVVVDHDPASFERLSKSFQGEAVCGVAFDSDTLEKAGIKEADAFACLTNHDNTNLMAAEVARSIYGVGEVIARLYNPDKEQTYQALEIRCICGTVMLAEQFMQRIVKRRLNILAWTANNRVLLVEFECPPRFSGKTVGRLEREELLRVGMVTRGGETMVAARDTVLRRGDTIVAAVLAQRLQRVRRMVEPRR